MGDYVGSIPAARPLMENFDDRELGERAHFLFEYDPETGALVSRFTTHLATYPTASRHNLVRVDGRSFSAAVIVWVMHHYARPGNKALKRIDKNPGNQRIENLICGHSEVISLDKGYCPKVCLPGLMPQWLPKCPSMSMAQAAIANYTKAHRDDAPPPCKPPADVLRELASMGCPAKVYAPGESRLNEYLRGVFGVKPGECRGRVPPSPKQYVDDLV